MQAKSAATHNETAAEVSQPTVPPATEEASDKAFGAEQDKVKSKKEKKDKKGKSVAFVDNEEDKESAAKLTAAESSENAQTTESKKADKKDKKRKRDADDNTAAPSDGATTDKGKVEEPEMSKKQKRKAARAAKAAAAPAEPVKKEIRAELADDDELSEAAKKGEPERFCPCFEAARS